MKEVKEICREIRCDLVASIGHLGVGHIGGCLSIVDALAVLYFEKMNIDPRNPQMEGRDRLVLSKGHAGPALYATLANRGYFEKSELMTLNIGGTRLPSHCSMHHTIGVDMTTGSLGQGMSCAVGMALGSKLVKDTATIYTIIGDGESQEGQIWEAAMFAAAKKLDNLIAIMDNNRLQIDGLVEDVNSIAPIMEKWQAFGWNAISVADGNEPWQISAALDLAHANRGAGKPTILILNTTKGKGVSFVEKLGPLCHHTIFTEEDAVRAIAEIRGA